LIAWQDIIMGVCNIGFFLMAFRLAVDHKTQMDAGAASLTGLLLLVMSGTFISLGYFFSAAAVFATATQWFYMSLKRSGPPPPSKIPFGTPDVLGHGL
jgi:hypothetical protein